MQLPHLSSALQEQATRYAATTYRASQPRYWTGLGGGGALSAGSEHEAALSGAAHAAIPDSDEDGIYAV